ncbi:MAG: glycosyltransferase, partial [Candidatus Marinimicrobia bacterium]|nr:glycosyltransferase [Candidatus Neomarinimicrobiota bacterium]
MIFRLFSVAYKRKGKFIRDCKRLLTIFKNDGLIGVKQRIKYKLHHTNNQLDRQNYTEWISRYDTLTDETRKKMYAQVDSFTCMPLISVIMPTYNSNLNYLTEAIESVRLQLYPNWELCIADDASTDKVIRSILERYSKQDPRIKVVFREQNGNISKASNSALELVSGEWVALIDHDDILPEHALFWVANEIYQNPDIKLIYTDEDKIDEQGRRYDAYFKSDWNPDLFLSHNMFSHFGVYRADLIQRVAGFRVGFEGAQDYDLVLRCLEHVNYDQIRHIPRVL